MTWLGGEGDASARVRSHQIEFHISNALEPSFYEIENISPTHLNPRPLKLVTWGQHLRRRT